MAGRAGPRRNPNRIPRCTGNGGPYSYSHYYHFSNRRSHPESVRPWRTLFGLRLLQASLSVPDRSASTLQDGQQCPSFRLQEGAADTLGRFTAALRGSVYGGVVHRWSNPLRQASPPRRRASSL